MSLSYEDDVPPAPQPRFDLPPVVVTWALIAANVALFLLEVLWSRSGILSDQLDRATAITLFDMGANFGRKVLFIQPWRALSSAFLHGGLAHIAMNMWALYVLGSFLERVIGPARLLVVYSVSALVGGLTSGLVHEGGPAIGASGAVWGLMLSQIVLLVRLRRDVNISWGQLAQPLVINLAITALPGIDAAAHLGGGIAGGALTLLVPKRPVGTDDGAWRPWAVAGVLLMLASIVAALYFGRPWDGAGSAP